MSKLTAPMLSFTASGQIAKTMVFSTWKGIPYARKYVVPANPQTTAQTTQRGYVTSCVAAWKNYLAQATGRTAWNRTATALSETMSGFNAFMRNAIQEIALDPDASFARYIAVQVGNKVLFQMKNLDDGAAGDEAGNFEIWKGTTISGMTNFEEIPIAAGDLLTSDLGDIGDVLYIKVRKDSFDRSGIAKVTLVA